MPVKDSVRLAAAIAAGAFLVAGAAPAGAAALQGSSGQSTAAAAADSPLEVVRESNERILAIYRAADEVDGAVQRRIVGIMDDVTAWERITEEAVAPVCGEMSPAECSELREVFAELLRASSIARLGRYRADRFEYRGQEVEGDCARVDTLAWYEDDDIAIEYELELLDGSWKIVNYVVDGVDTVRNYQKQFARLLRQETPAEVIARLRAKIAEYGDLG